MGPIELLVAFVNSEDHEEQTDDLTTTAELATWLTGHGLLRRRDRATQEDLALARDLRAALHAAMVANHDRSVVAVDALDDDAAAAGPSSGADASSGAPGPALDDVAAALPLRVVAGPDGPSLAPVHDGVRGALSELLVAVNRTVVAGSWDRLKICWADDCRWAYLDTTKNRSRAWCEWGCGNKAKTRAYRARKKAAAATG
jgi:predicted RNA-binding Zn ribbon-like protein